MTPMTTEERETLLLMAEQYLYKPQELEQTFRVLVEQWREDTMLLSSIEKKVIHPAYQRIIGLGRQVVPLILHELQARPSYWFWALTAITGEDPTQPGDNVRKAVAAWVQWSEQHGYTT